MVCGGDPNKCCDNGTCVDKCDPDGAPCSWTEPGIQSGCPSREETGECDFGVEGQTCEWHVIETFHSSSAKCATCASDCKHWAGNCVKMAANVCKTHFFLQCHCSPIDNPPTILVGDYYECN